MGDQLFAYLYHACRWNRQPYTGCQSVSKQFVRQYPGALGIVLKFYDVVGLLGWRGIGFAPHQVGLRSAAHSANLLQHQRHEARMLSAKRGSRQGKDFRNRNWREGVLE